MHGELYLLPRVESLAVAETRWEQIFGSPKTPTTPIMPHTDEDWSDSDEGSLNQREDDGYTDVHLGIPSDRIEDEGDLQDAYVSRIGGTPSFLAYPHPSPNSSKCKNCNEPAELLVQMLCNLEESPFERVLYVWACAKPPCQRKDGAVRAWRSLRYDAKYAKRLERKKQKKVSEQLGEDIKPPRSNPFAAATTASNPFSAGATEGGFGFGDQIMGFGGPSETKSTPKEAPDEGSEESTDEDEASDVEQVTTQLQKSTLGPSVDWSKQPHYLPIYLETESEYLPPAPKTKPDQISKKAGPSGSDGGEAWGKEIWEESQNVDDLFLRFTQRIEAAPKQCVRYELNGHPLFYQADKVHRSLHSVTPGTLVPVTGAAFVAEGAAPKRTYNPTLSSMLPKCSICKSNRRFEFQLMPNLINMLKTEDKTNTGMEWGTCLVYTCEKDCCTTEEGEELKECWREEVVLVQWEE